MSSQGGNAEGHGDAMIAERFECRTVQRLSAGNIQAVLAFFDLRSHATEIDSERGNAVGLLDPQFFRIADFDSLLGVRRDGGQDGNFATLSAEPVHASGFNLR